MQMLLKQGYVAPGLKSSLQNYTDVSYRTWLYIWVSRWMSYKKQTLLTLREQMSSPRKLSRVRVADLFKFVFCSCCDVHSDFYIQTMFRSSLPAVVCRRAHVLLLIVQMYIGTQNGRRFKKRHTWFSTINVTILLTKRTTRIIRWLLVIVTNSFTCSSFCHWKLFWRFYFFWINIIVYCIPYDVSILLCLRLRILLILNSLLLALISVLKAITVED